MRVSLPHKLSRKQVRERLRTRAHEIAGTIPAEVDTSWADEDHLNLAITTMGQTLRGDIAIGDSELVIDLALPLMMSFFEPAIAEAIRDKGQKLLA